MSRGSLIGTELVTRMPLKGPSCSPVRLRSRTRKLEMNAFQQMSDLKGQRGHATISGSSREYKVMTRLSSEITKYVIDGHRVLITKVERKE